MFASGQSRVEFEYYDPSRDAFFVTGGGPIAAAEEI